MLLSLLVAGAATVCANPSGALADGPSPTGDYTVQAGDSLVGIAHRFGIRLAVLLDLNHLTVTSVIHPGQPLVVPAGTTISSGQPANAPTVAATSTGTTAAGTTTSYTVQRGDALSGIAYRHGVTLKALLTTNKLVVTSTIMPGRVLQIPPATKPIPAVAVPTATAAAVPVPTASIAAVETPTEVLVAYLKAQVGKPYKFFTAGPDTFDCSGLVVAGYKQIGIDLIHQSGALAKQGRAVDLATESIVAGDVIVLSSPTDPTLIAHVGVAVSATTWIQAVGPGVPVQIRALPTSRIVTVRRMIGQ